MSNIEYKKYPKGIKEYIVYNGDTLPDFYRPARVGRGADFYIKFYTYLFDYHLTHDVSTNPFYVSTNGIRGIFNTTLKYKDDKVVKAEGFGNNYCKKTIERALRRLERLKLISYTKAPKKADRENPDEFIPHRIIHVDMDVAKELFNIYEPEVDQFIKDYAIKLAVDEVDADNNLSEEQKGERLKELSEKFKKWLKKIAQKRPYNYTEKKEEKYQNYKEAGIHRGKYNTADEMISYYQYHVAKKYTKKNLFNKYLPTHLKDKQKEADRLARSKASPYGELTEEDIRCIKRLNVADALSYVNRLIGYSISNIQLQKQAERCFIQVDKEKHTITGYDLDKAKVYMDKNCMIAYDEIPSFTTDELTEEDYAYINKGWNRL